MEQNTVNSISTWYDRYNAKGKNYSFLSVTAEENGVRAPCLRTP